MSKVGTESPLQGGAEKSAGVPTTPLARSFHPLQWAFSTHFAHTPSTLLFHHDLGLNPRPLTPRPGHAFTGEGVGERNAGSCGIKPGPRPGEDGQDSDALHHPLLNVLHDGNPNSHHHPRQLLRCWNFHRVYHNH